MKNYSKVITLSLVIAGIAIVSVLVYHTLFVKSDALGVKGSLQMPTYEKAATKPNTSLNNTTMIETEVSADTSQETLQKELQSTVDDEGTAEFDALKKDAATL